MSTEKTFYRIRALFLSQFYCKPANIAISWRRVKTQFHLESQAEILSKIPSSCSKSDYGQTLIAHGISSNCEAQT